MSFMETYNFMSKPDFLSFPLLFIHVYLMKEASDVANLPF